MSHERAADGAARTGLFDDEIVHVTVPQRRGDPLTVTEDEGVRPGTTAASLARLRPAFSADGTVTAGSASQISDGAAAVVVMSPGQGRGAGRADPGRDRGARHRRRAGPVAAVPAVQRDPQGARAGGQDAAATSTCYEINEAFASVAIQSMRDLEIDASNVNVNGGAIAMGHPVGASGARIALHLALELGRRGGGLGAAGLCGGGGQGEALLLHVRPPDTGHTNALKRGTAQHGRHDRPGRPGHRRYPGHRAGDQRTARRPRCRGRRGLLARQGSRREVRRRPPAAPACTRATSARPRTASG